MEETTAEAIRAARLQRIEALLVPLCERHGVTREEVLGRRRTAVVANARHELMAILWMNGVPLIEIGRLLGRDHTTVIGGVQKVLGPDAYRREMQRRRTVVATGARDYGLVIEDLAIKLRVAS